MKNKNVKKTVISAMLLCMGLILPFFTGQLREIGKMLLPMHFPVFLCGLICGWQYGLIAGIILPVMRSVLFSMPVLYPNAVAMSVELATYGFVSGFLYMHFKKHNTLTVYMSIIPAMIAGRILWGTAEIILLDMQNKVFTFAAFMSGALLDSLLGIVVQLILIPAIMFALQKTKQV